MEVNSVKCDGCGIQKGENNHWFRVLFKVDRNDPTAASVTISAWALEPTLPHYHLCSDSCVVKMVQQWLSSQKEGSDADRRHDEGIERVGSEVERAEEVSEVREDG